MDAGDKYGLHYTFSVYDPCGSKHYGQFYGKANACANGVYQALSPPLKGPGYEAISRQGHKGPYKLPQIIIILIISLEHRVIIPYSDTLNTLLFAGL